MDRVGDAFVWPVRDPEWPGKLLIIALTLLIPIVGAINGLGWMLATLDRLRAGEDRMAPANLGYIGRGAPLFVVQLGYGLGVAAVALVIYLPAVLLAVILLSTVVLDLTVAKHRHHLAHALSGEIVERLLWVFQESRPITRLRRRHGRR